MKITQAFLDLGVHEGLLNKTQHALLGQEFPAPMDWKELVLGQEISVADSNLFLLLRGKLPLTVQKQLVANYKALSAFHKVKREQDNTHTKTSIKTKAKNKENRLSIYCDGACQGNPGRAGSGLAVYDGEKPTLWYGHYTANGTNNTAELYALYHALVLAKDKPKVTIYSDSKYSIDCISLWAYSWKAKGWTKKGGEIKNLELIKMAHTLYDSLKQTVNIKHVKGHSGVEGNELADRMAVHAIKAKNETFEVYEYEDISNVLSMSEG